MRAVVEVLWYDPVMRRIFLLVPLVACGSPAPAAPTTAATRSSTSAEKSDPRAGDRDADATWSSFDFETPNGGSDGSEKQADAVTSAVHACWVKARGPDSAGMLFVEIVDIERDGSFRVRANNWVRARVFGNRFFGGADSDAADRVVECTSKWLENQSFPGMRKLRASFRLLPASACPTCEKR